MARWHGIVGYAETKETSPGVWKEEITEHTYFGNVIRCNNRRDTASDSTNDNIVLDAQISIIADQFAYQSFQLIKYVEYLGTKWKVSSVDPSNLPRLVLTLGGVYNG